VKRIHAVATLVAAVAVAEVIGTGPSAAAKAAAEQEHRAPQLLSQTGLYASDGGPLRVHAANRPFSPQYPLWSDGARKSRWVRLPEGATIDAHDIDRWDFPVGIRFWKEFAFGGRKVETRFLRKDGPLRWTLASYVWNEAQTDAVLAPVGGIPDVAEVAPGKRHSIPSVDECRACHDSARTEILGFNALQLSTDRDPNAPHAEPLAPQMVTLRALVDEQRIVPARPDLITNPPRIEAPDARTRAVLGYLSTNCGSCHNEESSIANLGLILKARIEPRKENPVRLMMRRTAKWEIPGVHEGTSAWIVPGAPDLSAMLVRMRSRRPSSQMPPLGTVLHDRNAIDLVTDWIRDLK
jgi:hypothetical protein